MRQQLETMFGRGKGQLCPSAQPEAKRRTRSSTREGPPYPAHLVLRDVDEKLLLQELLQDVFGSHVNQGLEGKGPSEVAGAALAVPRATPR